MRNAKWYPCVDDNDRVTARYLCNNCESRIIYIEELRDAQRILGEDAKTVCFKCSNCNAKNKVKL